MKKLLIAACAVAFATVTQASSIWWGGDIGYADQTALDSGSTAYLLWNPTSGSTAATTITLNDSTSYSAWTVDNGWSVVAEKSLATDVGNWTFKTTYGSATEAVAGHYAIVVVDGDVGHDGATGSYNYAGQDTNTDPMASNMPNLYVGSGAWDSKNPDWIGANGFTAVSFVESIPEPTSGLLLLLGMGALALRRRRA